MSITNDHLWSKANTFAEEIKKFSYDQVMYNFDPVFHWGYNWNQKIELS